MKIEVEVREDVVCKESDTSCLWIRARVLVNGRRERGLEQAVFKDDLRSYFDIIWEEIGEKIKRAYVKESKDD